eukprot:TRINITY_DN11260_c0_g3_i2.p2 TRINITY_DN11260_c0_g3~~TRINITY_DN11260_c0_g3_i2.p2  ORF type:complete len:168 (+),score=10.97 TRINITY_DN11260_c0_g3_i2:142-645(+)
MTWKLLEQACLDGDLLTVETILAPLSQLSRQYLMQRRAPVTLLHSACSAGHLTVAQLLIAEGADMEAALSDGMTPLHLAYCNKCLDVANMLIKLGADVKAEDAAGKIPFDYRPKQIIRHHLPTKVMTTNTFLLPALPEELVCRGHLRMLVAIYLHTTGSIQRNYLDA